MNWSNYSDDTSEGGKRPKVHCRASETSTITWFLKSVVLFCADWSYWWAVCGEQGVLFVYKLKWFVACLKVQFYVLHFLMLPFKNIISKYAHFLLFVSFFRCSQATSCRPCSHPLSAPSRAACKPSWWMTNQLICMRWRKAPWGLLRMSA